MSVQNSIFSGVHEVFQIVFSYGLFACHIVTGSRFKEFVQVSKGHSNACIISFLLTIKNSFVLSFKNLI